MHLCILALDLDGTLAQEDLVAPKTWQALRSAKAAGFALLLVTGRRLSVIPDIGPFDELFEAIIAENGATIFFPHSNTTITPFGVLAPEVIEDLKQLAIPIEFGRAIAATWTPYDLEVIQVLSKTGYAATLEFNKGAVMILPPGATKGSGLQIALEKLGYSARNVIACGDAENDRSMFEQADLAVAVANATPQIKDLADAVLEKKNGAGARHLIQTLLRDEMPLYRSRPERTITLGTNAKGERVSFSPFDLVDSNLGIMGSSGSGKSWLAGFLTEELLKLGYQLCIIDPEGDYRSIRAFPQTILLGSEVTTPPSVPNVITLLEYAKVSIILDLSLYNHTEKVAYITDFLQALCGLRANRGHPHWFLIDEAHYFCHTEGDLVTELVLKNAEKGGFGFITYQPSLLAPSILKMINHWMFTKMTQEAELAVIRTAMDNNSGDGEQLKKIRSLSNKQIYLSVGKSYQYAPLYSGVISLDKIERTTQHVRHLHKYLLAPLPKHKRFFYKSFGSDKAHEPAISLWDFREAIRQLPVDTIRYHLRNEDFERWIREVFHDNELARQIHKLSQRNMDGPELRKALYATIANRFEQLESLV